MLARWRSVGHLSLIGRGGRMPHSILAGRAKSHGRTSRIDRAGVDSRHRTARRAVNLGERSWPRLRFGAESSDAAPI